MRGDPISKQCGLLVTETNVLRVSNPQQAAIVLKSPVRPSMKGKIDVEHYPVHSAHLMTGSHCKVIGSSRALFSVSWRQSVPSRSVAILAQVGKDVAVLA